MQVQGPPSPPKKYKSYDELLNLLEARGMVMESKDRAKRKLAQVGYYRLSGYSYSCRKILFNEDGTPKKCDVLKRPQRDNLFQFGTSFNKVFSLYLFDKKLRILMMDALERIEVHIRSLIAHEVGKGHKIPGTNQLQSDPMAWQNTAYINNKHLKPKGKRPSDWDNWQDTHKKLINRCREDCIKWHKEKNKSMPLWVVIEAWDFGTLSKYFGMLKNTYRMRVCARLGLNDPKDPVILSNWLMAMNILRNRCAHHSRIWNQRANNPISFPDIDFFNALKLDDNSRYRLFGIIVTMHYLLKQIGPSSTWMNEVMALISHFPELPGCNLTAIGMPEYGFPTNEDLDLGNVTLLRAEKTSS